jgi:hypothetical protein
MLNRMLNRLRVFARNSLVLQSRFSRKTAKIRKSSETHLVKELLLS